MRIDTHPALRAVANSREGYAISSLKLVCIRLASARRRAGRRQALLQEPRSLWDLVGQSIYLSLFENTQSPARPRRVRSDSVSPAFSKQCNDVLSTFIPSYLNNVYLLLPCWLDISSHQRQAETSLLSWFEFEIYRKAEHSCIIFRRATTHWATDF